MYTKVNWQNLPSTLTALEAVKLNQMDGQYDAVANDIFAGSTDVNNALNSRYGADTGWQTTNIFGVSTSAWVITSQRWRAVSNRFIGRVRIQRISGALTFGPGGGSTFILGTIMLSATYTPGNMAFINGSMGPVASDAAGNTGWVPGTVDSAGNLLFFRSAGVGTLATNDYLDVYLDHRIG